MHRTERRSVGLRQVRILLAMVAVVALVAACDPPTPDQDAFYTAPDPLPEGDNGDVIWSRESTFTLDPIEHLPVPGVDSWQVLYQTENATGETIAVAGTVLVPTTPWLIGNRPVVGYSVGTRGLGDACAPSYTLTQGADYEGPFISAALARGWAVAISDYEGLGTPGVHTYMVGASQGRAALDMVRAALALPEAGLAGSAPVGLMGYSQGGGAAGWAAELASTYAPDLNLKGSALGGVPGDLGETAEFLDGSLAVAFALMAASGLDTAYDELDLENYLNARGEALLQTANDLCLVSIDGFLTLIDTAFTDIDDYVTTNPLSTPAWESRLDEQQLGSVGPTDPVFQYHGLIDEVVPYPQAADLRRDWCDNGTKVTWVPLPAEHITGLAEGFVPALDWMTARFSGLPTFGNCLLP